MRLILIALLSICFSYSYGQIVIDENDMPHAPFTHVMSHTSNTGTFDYTLTGSNFTWDFSFLVPEDQDTLVLYEIGSLPLTYTVVFNSFLDPSYKSNVVADGNLFIPPTSSVEVKDPYDFFRRTSSEYEQVGLGAKLNNIATPVKLDNKDEVYFLPLNFGDIDSSKASYDINVPTVGGWAEYRSRKYEVDGWGQLILPLDTFEVLRIKTTIDFIDTINYNGMSIPLPHSETIYSWWAKNQNVPVLQITEGYFSTDIAYIDTLNSSSIQSFTMLSRQNIYPNPSDGPVFFSNPNETQEYSSIHIFTLDGKLVHSQSWDKQPQGSINLKEMGLKPGLYYIQIKGTKGILSAPIILQ